jgi:hypothetical protein
MPNAVPVNFNTPFKVWRATVAEMVPVRDMLGDPLPADTGLLALVDEEGSIIEIEFEGPGHSSPGICAQYAQKERL